jgi:hypothetical protein
VGKWCGGDAAGDVREEKRDADGAMGNKHYNASG